MLPENCGEMSTAPGVRRYSGVVKPNQRKSKAGGSRKFRPRLPNRDRVLACVQQTLATTDAELLEIQLTQEGNLHLVLDREQPPVDSGLLVAFIKGLRRGLLEAGIDPGELKIEVDSPGAHRLLTTARHFERFQGCKIRVTFPEKVDEKSSAAMELLGAQDGRPVVRDQHGVERVLAPEEYASIRLS